MADNKVTTVFTANTREFEAAVKKVVKDLDGADKKNQSFADNAKKGYLQAAAAVGGFAFAITKMTKSASDLEETTAKFNTVFKSTTKDMSAEVSNLTNNYAMSTREARKNLAAMQDLLVPMGMNANRAADMSSQVVKLAADLGSFNNLPTAQVMADMQSAMVGNFETMKKYGVVLNATVVQQEALRMGLKRSAKELTAADKAQAAFNLITKGSAAAIGDMARTSDSYANQTKAMKAAMEDLTAGLGQAFLPIMKDIVGVVSDVVKWFNSLDDDTKKVITTIAAMGGAIAVLTKAATAFGASWKSALGPIALGVTLFTSIIALSGKLSINIDKVSQSARKLGNDINISAKSQAMANSLKRMEKGTAAYNRQVKAIIKMNPKLVEGNKLLGKSYADIGDQIGQLAAKQNSLFRLQAQFDFSKLADNFALEVGRINKIKLLPQLQDLMAQGPNAVAKFGQSLASIGTFAGKSEKELLAMKQQVFDVFYAMRKVNEARVFSDAFGASLSKAQKQMAGLASTTAAAAKKMTGAFSGALDKTKKGVKVVQDTLFADYNKMLGGFQSSTMKANEFMQQASNMRYRWIADGLAKEADLRTAFSQQNMALIVSQFGQEKANAIVNMADRLADRKQMHDALFLMDQAAAAARLKQQQSMAKKEVMTEEQKNMAKLKAAGDFFGSMASLANTAGKKFFTFYQAMAMSQAVISGYEAATAAWAKGMQIGGPPVAGIFLAGSIAATAAQVAGIAAQKPAKLEFGGIIPPSAQGSIIAGEKNKAEAIIPLEGEGAERLRASGIGGANITVDMSGAMLVGDDIPDKVAEGIDRAIYRLGLTNNSLVMQGG